MQPLLPVLSLVSLAAGPAIFAGNAEPAGTRVDLLLEEIAVAEGERAGGTDDVIAGVTWVCLSLVLGGVGIAGVAGAADPDPVGLGFWSGFALSGTVSGGWLVARGEARRGSAAQRLREAEAMLESLATDPFDVVPGADLP